MLSQVPENKMLSVRGLLAFSWLGLIGSFVYQRHSAGSPGLSLFWNLIWLLPALLMIVGHETWRRICPLSFFSQIPRMLRLQRKKDGSPRVLEPTSWLARHHNYLQFGLLFSGISLRLLLLQYDELWLGVFLLALLGCAMLVGSLYGGRSWCQYFCPIAPVQRFYSSPAGLLESSAHLSNRDLTQSMCRTRAGGRDVPACVGCKVNCPDIDLEQAHWADLRLPGRSLVYYGYPGLVLGFFLCLRIFGTGLSRHDPVIAGQVPLVLAASITGSWLVFKLGELLYGRVMKVHPDRALHQTSALATWLTFNLFYALAAGPLLQLPTAVARRLGILLVGRQRYLAAPNPQPHTLPVCTRTAGAGPARATGQNRRGLSKVTQRPAVAVPQRRRNLRAGPHSAELFRGKAAFRLQEHADPGPARSGPKAISITSIFCRKCAVPSTSARKSTICSCPTWRSRRNYTPKVPAKRTMLFA